MLLAPRLRALAIGHFLPPLIQGRPWRTLGILNPRSLGRIGFYFLDHQFSEEINLQMALQSLSAVEVCPRRGPEPRFLIQAGSSNRR